MDNSKKIILDLCGGTGAWSKPYRDAGYDVRVITSPEWDVMDAMHYCDEKAIRFYRKDSVKDYMDIEKSQVYGILAAPPCTQFSIARRTAKLPPDYRGALKIVEACEKIIRECGIAGGLKFWALENPRGKLRFFMGIPRNTFYQWQFGGQHKKPSDIWGFYNPPNPTVKIEPNFDVDKSWQKPIAPEEYKNLKLNRAAIRAITPAGFAQAFYEANK